MRGKAVGSKFKKEQKGDFYQTPYLMTEELLKRIDLEGFSILDPACGKGAIIDQLKSQVEAEDLFFTDITGVVDDYVHFGDLSFDFLSDLYPTTDVDWVITNPPFSLANEFIHKAKIIARKGVAMLLPLTYLTGQARFDSGLYNELKSVLVFTRQVMLDTEVREDGKYKAGNMYIAWFIWEKGYTGSPEIEWIDSKDHILRKGE